MPKKVPNSYKVEKVNYDKLKHETSVDQSDRYVPYNLRQSGPTKVDMLISTRGYSLQSCLSSKRLCKT